MKRLNIFCRDKLFRVVNVSLSLTLCVGLGVGAAFAQRPGGERRGPQDRPSAEREPQGRPDAPNRGPQGRPENAGENAAANGEKPGDAKKNDAGSDGDRRGPQRQIPLDEALVSGSPTAPILLNQNNFVTEDGVRLVGNFYRGRGDADAIPVLLLHDREGNKEEMNALAQLLAANGCAVVVPDLRGCGGSVNRTTNDFSRGNMPTRRQNRQYLMKDFNNDDLRAMIEYDGARWFDFLVYLHQKEMVDVKKTIVVGAGGLGSALAAAWTKADWQGKGDAAKNVVGLVLLSPDATNDAGKFNALSSLETIRKLAKGKGTFGFLVFVGTMNEEKFADAQEIQKKIGGKKDEELPPEQKLIPIVALKTATQGTELLGVESFGVSKTIQQFIARRTSELPKKRQKREEIE